MVPTVVLIVSVPLALSTSMLDLKYYARWLFGLTVVIFTLILISIILVEYGNLKIH